jgi:hypothetical protein
MHVEVVGQLTLRSSPRDGIGTDWVVQVDPPSVVPNAPELPTISQTRSDAQSISLK